MCCHVWCGVMYIPWFISFYCRASAQPFFRQEEMVLPENAGYLSRHSKFIQSVCYL